MPKWAAPSVNVCFSEMSFPSESPYAYHTAECEWQVFVEVQQFIHRKAIMPGHVEIEFKKDPVLPLGVGGAQGMGAAGLPGMRAGEVKSDFLVADADLLG